MYESGLKTLGLVEQVGCVTRGSTGGIVFLHVFHAMLCKENVGCYVQMYIIIKRQPGEQKRLATKTTISIDNCQQQNKYHHTMSINFISTERKLHVFLDGVIIIRFRFSNVTVNK